MNDLKWAAKAGLFILPLVLLVGFQNCDGGFKPIEGEGLTSGNGDSLIGGQPTSPSPTPLLDPRVDPAVLRIKIYDQNRTLLSSGTTLTASNQYLLTAIGFSATQTLTWTFSSNTGGCNLSTGVLPFQATVSCLTQGAFTAVIRAVDLDGTAKTASSQHALNPVTPDYCLPLVGANPAAVFRIPLGTAANAWNTAQAPISVAVGQTLRICNDDNTPHRFATNGLPCAQQLTAMNQGMFFDCLVTSTNTAGIRDGQTGASFSVLALDGRALFATHCQNCHGADRKSVV